MINCPRCKEKYEPCGYDDDAGEWECENCGFNFEVSIDYEPNYSVVCSFHNWEQKSDSTLPNGYKRCKYCMVSTRIREYQKIKED